MVDLHWLDAPVQAGIRRYSWELAAALEALGVPVRRFPVRPREVMLGRRRTGGYLSVRLQSLWRPLRKRGVLHSTHLYAAHPRADVATVHDCFPETRAAEHGTLPAELRWFRHVMAGMERRGAHYIAPTRAVRKAFLDLHGEVDPGRVHVTYEGVGDGFHPSASGERPHLAFRSGAFNVLCVADLTPRKRLDWLLDAALQVGDSRLRIVHVGAGTARRTAWVAQRQREDPLAARLGPALVRLGHLDDGELARAYRSADLFVLPSLDEGFGFPPLEALRSGTPVAVTDRPVFREVLGDHADYFEGPDGLAGVLQRALARGRPGPAQRERNHAFVRDTYTWEKAARLTRDVYAIAAGG